MIATITTYQWLLSFHILTAVAWVGGALMLNLLATFAVRSTLPGRKAEFAHEAALVGERVFSPLSLILLGLGIWLIHQGHGAWKYSTLWVTLGLVGWGLSFVVGVGFLAPQSKRIARAIAEHGPDSPQASQAIDRILLVARADAVLLVLIVLDMALKPG
jgi:uncharacterized membrane protein